MIVWCEKSVPVSAQPSRGPGMAHAVRRELARFTGVDP